MTRATVSGVVPAELIARYGRRTLEEVFLDTWLGAVFLKVVYFGLGVAALLYSFRVARSRGLSCPAFDFRFSDTTDRIWGASPSPLTKR